MCIATVSQYRDSICLYLGTNCTRANENQAMNQVIGDLIAVEEVLCAVPTGSSATKVHARATSCILLSVAIQGILDECL